MSPMARPALTLQDIPSLIGKYWKILLSGALIGVILFVGLSFVIPPRYKVSFMFTIDPRFFQSPLVGEFIPGAGSPGEMKTQGESLLRQSFTPEFLDSLDQQFHLYYVSTGPHEPRNLIQKAKRALKNQLLSWGVMAAPVDPTYLMASERQDLIRHIELFNAYGTTYRIGFIHSNPDTAYRVAQELYKNSSEFLLAFRTRNMTNIQDAMNRRLASLNVGADTLTPPPTSPVAPDATREQLDRVRNELRSASRQFTEAHPYIQELKKQESMLESELESGVRVTAAPRPNTAVDGEANKSLYGDLTRKINYLKIAMDSDRARQSEYLSLLEPPIYPSAPLFPKKPLFALYGFGFGVVVALFASVLLEYFDRSAFRAEVLAKQMDLPILGTLPRFSNKGSLPVALLNAPQEKGAPPSAPRV